MHYIFVIGLAVILPALAEELRAADIPSACGTICDPIVELTTTCDIDPDEADTDNDGRKKLGLRETDDDDDGGEEAIEADCICKNASFNVAEVLALCASCIAQNGATTNDADKIMTQCSFSPISYAPSATGVVQNVRVEATKPAITLGSSTTSSSSSAPTSADDNGSGCLAVPVAAAMAFALATLALL